MLGCCAVDIASIENMEEVWGTGSLVGACYCSCYEVLKKLNAEKPVC